MGERVAVWAVAGAAFPGVVAIAWCVVLWIRQRRLKADQRVLLPDGAKAGLLDRQAGLQRAIERLEEALDGVRSEVGRLADDTDTRLRTALRFQGLVRYDAYRDMGGQQSWSLALLDANRTGAVVTSLHARDHARVYMKELEDGVSGQRLSPEEERAVALAMEDSPPPLRPPA